MKGHTGVYVSYCVNSLKGARLVKRYSRSLDYSSYGFGVMPG